MKDELTSYARRHDLGELGDPLKELFERYNVVESTGQLQVSESCSQVPEEGSRSSDDEIRSTSSTVSTTRNLKLKPKASNTDAAQVSPVAGSTKKNTIHKTNPTMRTRGSLTKDSANSRSLSATAANNKSLKKPQKPTKQEVNKEKGLLKKKGKKSADEEGMSAY